MLINELIELFFESKRPTRITVYYYTKRIYIRESSYPSILYSSSSKNKNIDKLEMNYYFRGNLTKFLKILEKKPKVRDDLKSILEKEIILSNL